MNNNAGVAFGVGLFFGAVLLGALLILINATPGDQLQKDRQEAVDLGHAQWVASHNGMIVFVWNTNKCGLEKNR